MIKLARCEFIKQMCGYNVWGWGRGVGFEALYSYNYSRHLNYGGHLITADQMRVILGSRPAGLEAALARPIGLVRCEHNLLLAGASGLTQLEYGEAVRRSSSLSSCAIAVRVAVFRNVFLRERKERGEKSDRKKRPTLSPL